MKISIYIFAILVLFCATQVSTVAAYFTTEQKAERLSDSSILFNIEYKFGSDRYSYMMPIFAKRSNDPEYGTLGYNIVDEDGDIVADGQSVGMVFSNASFANGQYQIDRGVLKTMELFVLFDPKDMKVKDTEKLFLQVTSLPFVMIDRENNQFKGSLNPSELQYYITPEIN